MKKNRILIIIISFVVILILFLIGIKIINSNKTEVNNKKEHSTTYSKTFKKFTFDILNEVEYKELNEYEFELKTNKWHANLEPLIDEYDYILSYPLCTKKRFDDMKYKTGNLKKNEGDERKFISFHLVDNGENNVIAYYKIHDKFVMFVSLINNDNSFDEEGLKSIFKILSTAKYDKDSEKKYPYNKYLDEFYHQCHDIEKYDQQTNKKN